MNQKADKNFGQHFLTSTHHIDLIVNSLPDDSELILEVGPGRGAITKRLNQSELPFLAVEKDKRLTETLLDFLAEEQLHIEDALSTDWSKLTKGRKTWLASNLPYNVGSILFRNFFPIKDIYWMTLMFQKEVGLKILHEAPDKKSSSFSLLSGAYFQKSLISLVPPGAFSPPPRVDSIILFFERRVTPLLCYELMNPYERFLKDLFSQPRKTIRSNLREKSYGAKEELEQGFSSCKIDPMRRPETLNLQEALDLFKSLCS